MKFRKIKSIDFDEPDYVINIPPGGYAIYDVFEILVVHEENMSVQSIRPTCGFSIIYEDEWIEHPLKSESPMLGEDMDELSLDLDNQEVYSEIDILDIFSEIEKYRDLHPNDNISHMIFDSFGGNEFNVLVGVDEIQEGAEVPYLQISTIVQDDQSKEVEFLGVRLLLSRSNMDNMTKAIRGIREKFESNDFDPEKIKVILDPVDPGKEIA